MRAVAEYSIREFCETGSGGTPNRANDQYFGGNIPWVKSGELRESVIYDTEEKITELGLKESAAKLVPKGSILVALYGATVGRMALLGIDAATNQAVCNIRPDPKRADSRYVFHALQTKIGYFLSRAAGGAQPNISQGVIRETQIPLPPLDEQRRIAAILDKADALRGKRKQAAAIFEKLAHAIFRDMFQSYLAGEGRIIELGHAVEEFRYGTSNKSDATGHPVLRIPNVIGGQIDVSDLKLVPLAPAEFARIQLRSGDLLLVRTNGNPEYVGRCAVVDDFLEQASRRPIHSFAYASYLIRARLKTGILNPDFLQQYLTCPEGRKSMLERAKTSAGQFNINTESLASIPVPAPRIEQQQLYASKLRTLRTKLPMFKRGADQANDLFISLQHRAFAGELS